MVVLSLEKKSVGMRFERVANGFSSDNNRSCFGGDGKFSRISLDGNGRPSRSRRDHLMSAAVDRARMAGKIRKILAAG
jgi:hypothetical protein